MNLARSGSATWMTFFFPANQNFFVLVAVRCLPDFESLIGQFDFAADHPCQDVRDLGFGGVGDHRLGNFARQGPAPFIFKADMLKGVLHRLDDTVGINHLNAMTGEPFLDALIRIASASRKAVNDPEHEIIHLAGILFDVIENVVQDRPFVFSSAESFAEYCAAGDNGKSSVGHEFPANALLRIKAFAFLG